MSSVDFDEAALRRKLLEGLVGKMHEALAIYNAIPLEHEQAGYPFATNHEQGLPSIKDAASQSVELLPGGAGVRVKVEAPGAWFNEMGNDAGGTRKFIYPRTKRQLAIALSAGAEIVSNGAGGFLLAQRVHTYAGRHSLRKSVLAALRLG